MKKLKRIISGGQTGADRAAFDFALENGFETAGFVPKNRLAEDGRIPLRYENLTETETEDYAERTRLNVIKSDATLILSHGELKGGSLLTKELAEKYKKPFLHIDFAALPLEKAIEKTRRWLDSTGCENLNVAGSRALEDAGIYEAAKSFLRHLLID